MEIWDLFDKDGNRTGETFERGHGNFVDIPEGRYHMVSDILVKHVDGTYLLMKRDPNKDIYPGYWEASAGGSALQGETELDCAKRELREETGIISDNFTQISRVLREHSHSLIFSFLTVVDVPKDSITLQENETVDYKWITKKELLDFSESDISIKSQMDRYKSYLDELRK